jgi:hypothetical protein
MSDQCIREEGPSRLKHIERTEHIGLQVAGRILQGRGHRHLTAHKAAAIEGSMASEHSQNGLRFGQAGLDGVEAPRERLLFKPGQVCRRAEPEQATNNDHHGPLL